MHGEEAIYFWKIEILVEKFLLLRTLFTKEEKKRILRNGDCREKTTKCSENNNKAYFPGYVE